ncbi:MAG: glycosyltransferase family 9 protein [Ferruginibacter sp.]
MKPPKNIILSRTDGIGDMVLMLPMAGVLKAYFPGIKIAVLGKSYTKALVDACVWVDEFIDARDFFEKDITVCGERPEVFINVRTEKQAAHRAKKLRIPVRIGTKSRLYHWTTCNRLVKLSRRSSDLHEVQLNMKLLKPLGIVNKYSTAELQEFYGLERLQPLQENNATLIRDGKYNLIIHPKSQGSSREWPIGHFAELINMLDEERFNIFLSGVEKEIPFLEEILSRLTRPVISLGGKMPLDQFLPFIKACDGILANATGPVHLGAALGVDAFGLYPPIRPIHPGRWAPLGPGAQVFVHDKSCKDCRNSKDHCRCMEQIQPSLIKAALEKAADKKFNTGTNPTT